MTTDRPIIFTAESVRAILDGRKTQTRRVIRPQPVQARDGKWDWKVRGKWSGAVDPRNGGHSMRSPYGKPGDRLWVRETWALGGVPGTDASKPYEGQMYPYHFYRASTPGETHWRCWKRSIFMPRNASRITLQITAVRVERLQAISHSDVLAESGQFGKFGYSATSDEDFAMAWDKINGKRAPWASNPWVWVIEFTKVPQ